MKENLNTEVLATNRSASLFSKGMATKYLDHYLSCFMFDDSRSHESAKHNIKEY